MLCYFSVRKCAGSNGLWYVIRTSELCGLFVFLRDRNMIRCACGNSYAEHDVYIDEQKDRAQKGARRMRRGARRCKKGAEDAAGCAGMR